MSLASLEGVEVTTGIVTVPAWGAPWVDVSLLAAASLAGPVTLSWLGQSIACTVVSGGAVNGRAAYRLAVGAGGWGKETKSQGYADDMGIKIGLVVGDAAAAVGESVEGFPSDRMGPHFARAAEPASHVLHSVTPRNWRVDFDGVTRYGLRPSSSYSGDGVRTRRDVGVGVVELATESIVGLLPGVQVDGMPQASDVEYCLTAKRHTVRVYYAPVRDRRLAAWAKIFDALDPRRRYRCPYEYRVVSQSGERLNLQIVRVATGMPDLARVPVRPGMAGIKATVADGELVLVSFIDGDPSRPCVTSHDAPDAPGWNPQLITMGDASDFVALAAKVQAEDKKLWDWNIAHVHPHSLGPTLAASSPATPQESTASGKVKSE